MVKIRYTDEHSDEMSSLTVEALRQFLEPLADDVKARPPGVLSWVFGKWGLTVRVLRVYRDKAVKFTDFERELGEVVVNRVIAQVLVGTGRYRYGDASLEYVRPILPAFRFPG